MFNPCAVIPVYNHEHAVGDVVKAVLSHKLVCILVDDGSSQACADTLDALEKLHPARVHLLRHAQNRGKGGAVLTGIRAAQEYGFTHALQIDADGQHNMADIPKFIQLAKSNPEAVIAGYPCYDDSVPKLRFIARYLTHLWVLINTLSFQIKDAMCGFRMYPVQPVITLSARQVLGERMNFDPEILVRLSWQGVPIVNVPTQVGYPRDGVSHFRLWLDNVLISRMHATLFLGMLRRFPRLIARRWIRK